MDPHDAAEIEQELNDRLRDNVEYERGRRETQEAQLAGPPGSAAREAAYIEMEMRWEREGFDG